MLTDHKLIKNLGNSRCKRKLFSYHTFMIKFLFSQVSSRNLQVDYELRVIVEKVSVTSQEVVQRDTLKVYDIKAPTSNFGS